MFISFLYMFRVTMCPSSGEITVSMRHLVFVTLHASLSGMQGRPKHGAKKINILGKIVLQDDFIYRTKSAIR
jgi:hypothetical protein